MFKSRANRIGHGVPTACHDYNVYLKGAVLPGRNDVEMSLLNLLRVSA